MRCTISLMLSFCLSIFWTYFSTFYYPREISGKCLSFSSYFFKFFWGYSRGGRGSFSGVYCDHLLFYRIQTAGGHVRN